MNHLTIRDCGREKTDFEELTVRIGYKTAISEFIAD